MKITQKYIDKLLNQSEKDVRTVFDKVTQVTVELPNGYVLSECMGCIDKDNYSQKVGYDICVQRIKNKLWDLEGYAASKSIMDHCFNDKDIIHEDKRLKPDELTVKQVNQCMKDLDSILNELATTYNIDHRTESYLHHKVVQIENKYHLESLYDTITTFDEFKSTETSTRLYYSCIDGHTNIWNLIKKWDDKDYTHY